MISDSALELMRDYHRLWWQALHGEQIIPDSAAAEGAEEILSEVRIYCENIPVLDKK